MANELELIYTGTTKDIYAQLRNRDEPGKIAIVTGTSFETYNPSNIANYDLGLTDRGGSWWTADMPAWIASGVNLAIIYRRYQGDSPAATPVATDYVVAGPVYLTKSTIGAVATAPAGAAMSLTEAREIVFSNIVRSGGIWTNVKCDHAIKGALRWANFRSPLLRSRSTFAVGNNDEDVDIPASVTGFHDVKLIHARIGADPVEVVSMEQMRRLRDVETATGQPERIAFETPNNCFLHPKSNGSYTLTLVWRPDIAGFTAGTASPDAITFAIPADIMHPLLQFGAVSIMLNNDTSQRPSARLWQEFQRIVAQMQGTYGSDQGWTEIVPDE